MLWRALLPFKKTVQVMDSMEAKEDWDALNNHKIVMLIVRA